MGMRILAEVSGSKAPTISLRSFLANLLSSHAWCSLSNAVRTDL